IGQDILFSTNTVADIANGDKGTLTLFVESQTSLQYMFISPLTLNNVRSMRKLILVIINGTSTFPIGETESIERQIISKDVFRQV
uniref:MacB_PCD domain-containing protein n=1 Tax=Loa loa TaxID=7209 RepID=A0A1I7VJ75_LOALO